ncbi:DUF1835 domain-containing protein [Anaerosacchariphilus polymeriproducens]|uniref:DUF1835 domain-containing protein n=1 Tax=Anaerosacchariphilus polymeriproducens TaxID=1812858 RepID=A0A371AZY5_9FIRM|nr:DUF1835 domain-containing protein [Anaerosacchariphilus polymeriproducens]RDU25178.1 DUF1835 domain-containing protein [Anaerosacchariphilus polymeriproducens]
MIEILFGDSEAGAMKVAKNNTTDEVICLAFMLDIGDIKKAIDSNDRQDLIFSMYLQNGWCNRPDVLEELKMAGKIYINELNRLLEFLKKGESIRIWYSDSPYSLCGFYYLCNILTNYSNDVFTVKLPNYIQTSKNKMKDYSNWGEVSAEEFSKFLIYEKKMNIFEIKMYSDQWIKLVEDNSPLRAAINGFLIGVNEDFYDFLILRHLSTNPRKEARVIGDILGDNPLGVGDWWFAYRIEFLIHTGLVRVVEDSEIKYERKICKA